VTRLPGEECASAGDVRREPQSPAEVRSDRPYSDWVEDSDRLAGGLIRVR
jgi:hypothetical protein